MAWQYAALAGYQVISGLQQAEMVRMQADIQKQIDEFNAQMTEYDAWRVIGYGQTQMAQYQQQIDQAQAAGRVSAAGAGVSMTEGSIAELSQQNQLIGQMNLMEIENQTREKALGYTRQARNIRFASGMAQGQAQVQAQSIIGGSLMQAAGTAVSGYLRTPNAPKKQPVSESGYTFNASQGLSMSQPGSYLTGSSQDLARTTGYLGLP